MTKTDNHNVNEVYEMKTTSACVLVHNLRSTTFGTYFFNTEQT